MGRRVATGIRAPAALLAAALLAPAAGAQQATRVFWGDTHVHSSLSFDAATLGDVLGPEFAYRFARGEEVVSSTGKKLQLERPLDFLVVADHAEAYGALEKLLERSAAEIGDPRLRRWREQLEEGPEQRSKTVLEMAAALRSGEIPPGLVDAALVRSTWMRATALAEEYYDPGRFTPLVGYEWTSHPNGGENLHRVVIFRDGKDRVDRVLPFSALDSEDPEDLWSALAAYESLTGGQALAIPHNGNLSNGRMFTRSDFGGGPLTRRQAAARARWEPVVEVTQQKGDSETHPALSPDDEFADFERWDAGNLTMTRAKEPWMLEHEYARSALLLGLELGRGLGVNPFRFGMIGSSDTHTSLAGNDEDDFVGIGPTVEPGPGRMALPLFATEVATIRGFAVSASGYAGVWAGANTREALFDALRRREVFASTGPRMTVRFFGGFGFEPADAGRPDVAGVGYAKGVPMGGSLPAAPAGRAPAFLVAASRDPQGANLDRVQIVKGWLDDDGARHERVFDVAWSGERKPGPDGKLPPVGSTVDLAAARYTNAIGAAELTALWVDPAFDPVQPAFYYARVLEIPTPRWTAYDAKRFGTSPPAGDVPMLLQERAYTSPIWYEADREPPSVRTAR
jgi:hypothetical protein